MLMRIDHILLSIAILSTQLLNSSLVSGLSYSSYCVPQTSISENDEADRTHMRRAIQLAAQATGETSPNPCVGCVIVLNGTVVGEGWHKKAGSAHAEVNALLMAGSNADGATAYVSLEPCNHYGRTPPCTHALIRHGIKRVVAGMVDPDPRVSGYGLQYLRDNGVVVDIAQMEEAAACRSLNAPFVFRMQTDRAYGIVLSAADENGSICNPLGRYDSTNSEEPTVAELELSALLHQLAPETNAIVLTSSQFLTVPYSVLQALPLHITLAITVPSFNEEMAADILQIKGRIQSFRNACPPEEGLESRRWMILTPGVDAPVSLSHISCSVCNTPSADIEKMEDIEMHGFESCIEKSQECGTHMISTQLLLSVVKQMAILGFNAVLLLADTDSRLGDLQTSSTCQKLLIIEASSTVIQTSNQVADLESDEIHRNVVNSILSSIEIESTSDSGSDEIVQSSPIEGVVRQSYTAEKGEFHLIDTGLSSIELDSSDGETREALTRGRRNPLKVFSIQFWS